MFSGAHILPHMDYYSTVWGDSPHVHSLQLAQKRVTQSILDVKGKAIRAPANRSHILLSKLGWMNIQNHINFRKAVMIFKSLINLTPKYMPKMFNYAPNTINTRQLITSYNRKDLQIPTGTNKWYMSTVSHIVQ